MIRKLIYLALAVLLAVGLVALARNATRPLPLTPGTDAGAATAMAQSGTEYARIIDGLSATLQLEVTERQRMEEQIEAQGDQIKRLQRELAAVRADAPETQVAALDPGAEAPAGGEDAENSALAPFLEAGFDPVRAQQVKQMQDDIALQRLYLRDQAEREGWLRTPRYRDAMQAINAREEGMRQELGENDYDRYLYAIGRPNRVLVGDVLANGPAQQAGIQVGDAIMSYGGERIFEAGTLVEATRSGTAGMSTAVELERDGASQVVYVPRGPLGINLRVARVRPSH